MPAGTDLIVYSPRVGSTGDDRYSVDANSRWAAGSLAGYSVPPSVTEINAGTWYNQVIAEINRRRANFGLSARGYVAVGDRITASKMSGLKSDIDSLRGSEGLSAYSWTATYTAGTKITIQHMLDLRKALAVDHYFIRLTAIVTDAAHLRAGDNFYPPTTITDQGTVGDANVGRFTNGVAYQKHRYFHSFTLPALPTINAAKLRLNAVERVSGQGKLLNVYQASSHLNPVTTAHWGRLDTQLAVNQTLVTGFNEITLTGFTFASGGSYTLILTSNTDISDTPNPPTNDEVWLVDDLTDYELRLYT